MRIERPADSLTTHADRHHVSVILFLLGCVSAVLWFIAIRPGPLTGGGEMMAIAENITSTGTFRDPFPGYETGPTGVVAPLYPLFLSILMLVFGASSGMAASLFSVLLSGVHAALLPRVSHALLGRSTPGLWGALLFIAMPASKIMPAWEAWTAGTAVMVFCILSHHRPNPVLCGATLGAIVLLNPACALLAAAWLVQVTELRTLRGTLRWLGVMLFVACCTFAPWMLRNSAYTGSASVKTNFGMTLLASNNPCAEPTMAESFLTGCYQQYHPAGNSGEASLLREKGEGEYDRYSTSRTMEWIRSHRWRFAELTGVRALQFWFPSPVYHIHAYSLWAITVLALVGACFVPWRAARFLLGAGLCYSFPYSVVVSDVRYRYPCLWLSLILAGCAIERMLCAWRARRTAA